MAHLIEMSGADVEAGDLTGDPETHSVPDPSSSRRLKKPRRNTVWRKSEDPKTRPSGERIWNPRRVNGFARSAKFIVRDKDKASALFRRFDTSAMRNLLYLQARVASLEARQTAFDEEDFAALNKFPKPNDPKDPKTRLEELKMRLVNSPSSDRQLAEEDLVLRIEDLALCLDLPLKPLNVLEGGFPLTQLLPSTSIQVERRRPFREALLAGDLPERLYKIVSLVAYKNHIDVHHIEQHLDLPTHQPQRSDRDWLGWVADKTEKLERLLQDSLMADLDRRSVPAQLKDFNKSWEDMELFADNGTYERRKMDWERKREEALNRGEPAEEEWPWNLSEHWKEKMRDRYQVAMRLKEALNEYHEALVVQRAIFQLPQPAERTKTTQIEWFTGVLDKDDKPQFIDSSADIFGADMVSIGMTGDEDFFSKKLPDWMPSLFVAMKQSDRKVHYTSEKKVGRWVGTINGTAAIGFLVVAVWILSVVSDYKTKTDVRSIEIELGVMTAFIVAFALWVAYLTTLSRKEVFGAVAAYAAVLVVFVGGSGS